MDNFYVNTTDLALDSPYYHPAPNPPLVTPIPKPKPVTKPPVVADFDYVLPHAETYAGTWNAYNKQYYYYFDEALRDSQENALAMARDGCVRMLRRTRQYAYIGLPCNAEVDDPEDEAQVKVGQDLIKIINHVPKFYNLQLSLSEADFYGKAGAEIKWGQKRIDGKVRNTVVAHKPVNGDKIRFKWDDTPGIALNTLFGGYLKEKYPECIENTNLGQALFLKTDYLRERFIIHEFEPSDTDYLFEGDMAQSVHGLGLRSQYYWTWQILTELRSWDFDALQRVGVNGMLIGFFKSGNPSARAAVWDALVKLQKNNTAVFEVDPSYQGNYGDLIQNIVPSAVGYDVLYQLITHFEDIMRMGFLGQGLTPQSESGEGIGSGRSELKQNSVDKIIRSSAGNLAETLDDQLVRPMLKYNIFEYKGKDYLGDQLPFGVRLRFQLDRQDVLERIEAASRLAALGVDLDKDDLRELGGFSPPKNPGTAVIMPGFEGGPGMPSSGGSKGSPEGGRGPGSKPGTVNKPAKVTTPPDPKKDIKEKFEFDKEIFSLQEPYSEFIGHIIRHLNKIEKSTDGKLAFSGAAWNQEKKVIALSFGDWSEYEGNIKNEVEKELSSMKIDGVIGSSIKVYCEAESLPRSNGWDDLDIEKFELCSNTEKFRLSREELLSESSKVDPDPTPEQKKSGNYRKGHVWWNGLPITIETAKGQYRRGTSQDGKPWQTLMKHHYGYFKRSESRADGDHIDVFIDDDNLDCENVYIVNQYDPQTQYFDEHKCVIGADSPEDARKIYQANYQRGWKGFGGVWGMSIAKFKRWVYSDESLVPVTRDRYFLDSTEDDLINNVAYYLISLPLPLGSITGATWNRFDYRLRVYFSSYDIEVSEYKQQLDDILGSRNVAFFYESLPLDLALVDGWYAIDLDSYRPPLGTPDPDIANSGIDRFSSS